MNSGVMSSSQGFLPPRQPAAHMPAYDQTPPDSPALNAWDKPNQLPPRLQAPADISDVQYTPRDNPHQLGSLDFQDKCARDTEEFVDFARIHFQVFLSKLAKVHGESLSRLCAERDSRISSMQSELASLQERLDNSPDSAGRVRTEDQVMASANSMECNAGLSRAIVPTDATVESPASPEEQKASRRSFAFDSPAQTLSGFLSNLWGGSDDGHSESWGELLHKVNNPRFSLMRRMSGLYEHPDLESTSPLRRFVLSKGFDLLSGFAILGNIVVMGIQLEYNGFDIGHDIRPDSYAKSSSEIWPHAQDAFTISDALFNACFCAELLLRVYALRSHSLRNCWIWLDAITIALSLLDSITSGRSLAFDPSIIRLVRLVRLARLLKIFKALEAFDSLFLLLKAIHASLGALLWSFLLLVSVQAGVGLFLCQILQTFIADDSADPKDRDQVFTYFGTYSRTMITMFEITLANWVPTCRILVEKVHIAYFLFYIVYRCLFCFAVLKVIAAIFIAETNRVLAGDVELTLMKAHKEKVSYKEKLSRVFRSIDTHGKGEISWADMQMFLTDAERSAWLATVGFNRTDFEKLFWLIEVKGAVNTDKFLSMVGQLKGQAKTVDLLTLFKVIHKMDVRLRGMKRAISPGSSLLAEGDIVESEFDEQERALIKLGEGGTLINNDLDSVLGEIHIR